MLCNLIKKMKGNVTEHNARKKPFARRARRGAALTENLLVIGIVVLALVLILVLYGTVIKSYRSAQLSTQMTQIIGGLQRAYAMTPTYDTGNLIPVLDGGGDIPAAARVDTAGTITIQNPYGGAVTVVGAGLTAIVTINDIPQEACERFLEGFVGLNTKNTDIKSIKVGTTDQTIPLTRLAIATACVDGDNDVALVY